MHKVTRCGKWSANGWLHSSRKSVDGTRWSCGKTEMNGMDVEKIEIRSKIEAIDPPSAENPPSPKNLNLLATRHGRTVWVNGIPVKYWQVGLCDWTVEAPSAREEEKRGRDGNRWDQHVHRPRPRRTYQGIWLPHWAHSRNPSPTSWPKWPGGRPRKGEKDGTRVDRTTDFGPFGGGVYIL